MATLWFCRYSKHLKNVVVLCCQPNQRKCHLVTERCSNIVAVNHRNVHNEGSFFNRPWLQVPSSEEAQKMKQMYPVPERLIQDIMKPLTDMDPSHGPLVECTKCMAGRLWKVRISFTWPTRFHVCARSVEKSDAIQHAYLEACSFFECFGLLDVAKKYEKDKNYKRRDYREILLGAQEILPSFMGETHVIEYKSYKESLDGHTQWTCRLKLTWPYDFCTTAYGLTKDAAEQNASAMMIYKLRTWGYMDKYNKYYLKPCFMVPTFSEDLKPDYEFFVDASREGYGALLVVHPRKKEETVRWISQKWPDDDSINSIKGERLNSTFLEFYAFLSVLFTWKKKFSGSKVLVWTDCKSLSMLLMNGFHLDRSTKMCNLYYKSYKVLFMTCKDYNIRLRCQHVPRQENKAADSLSKEQMIDFMDHLQKLSPNASLLEKKSKKLLFYKPIICDNITFKGVLKNLKKEHNTIEDDLTEEAVGIKKEVKNKPGP